MNPLVSVVTPSFNQARWLGEALASVQAQTYAPIEHIVVDAGSTDGTLDLLEASRARWISEPDRGQSHALNKGFALAQGEILGWLNADDAYLPTAVEEGVPALTDSAAALVYADVTRVDGGGLNPRRVPSRPRFDLWTELNEGNGIYSPSVFFTRAALEAVGPVDETLDLTMDYDLWLRIGKRFPVHRVDAVWAVQRLHPEAKTSRLHDAFWPERLRVSRRHGGRVVSPLFIQRHVPEPAQRVVSKVASAAYTALGKGRP